MEPDDESPTRIGPIWDAMARGEPPADDLDPALTGAIRQLHAADDAPPARDAFLARLEERLMNETIPFDAATDGRRAADAMAWSGGRGAAATLFGHAAPTGPGAWLATAAIALLTAALAFGLARWLPTGSDDGPRGAWLVAASPAAEAATVCNVAPRPPEPTQGLDVVDVPRFEAVAPSDLPAGAPVDAAVADGIMGAVRRLGACEEADAEGSGSGSRLAALFTDELFDRIWGRLLAGSDPEPTQTVTLEGAHLFAPGMPAIETMAALGDGRVAAVVRPAEQPALLLTFKRVGDSWLIDELRVVIDGAAAASPEGTEGGAETILSDDCTVQPRETFPRSGAGGDPTVLPAPEEGVLGSIGFGDLLPGTLPDEATLAGIAETARQIGACQEIEDIAASRSRVFALYTDDYLERAAYPWSAAYLAQIDAEGGEPQPFWWRGQENLYFGPGMPAIEAARQLPDGRVAELIRPAGGAPAYAVFERVGDRWLIDELVSVELGYDEQAVVGSPAPEEAPSTEPWSGAAASGGGEDGPVGVVHRAATPATP